jgi:hypothetical protein
MLSAHHPLLRLDRREYVEDHVSSADRIPNIYVPSSSLGRAEVGAAHLAGSTTMGRLPRASQAAADIGRQQALRSSTAAQRWTKDVRESTVLPLTVDGQMRAFAHRGGEEHITCPKVLRLFYLTKLLFTN